MGIGGARAHPRNLDVSYYSKKEAIVAAVPATVLLGIEQRVEPA